MFRHKKLHIGIILIVFTGLLAYANSLFNRYTYDDAMVLTKNHHVKDISNLPRLFTQDYFRISQEKTFRPVAPLTLMIEYALFGDNPFGYHVINLLIHVGCALLILLLCRYLGYAPLTGTFAALVFLLHPALSETVFNISYMEDLWGLLFFLAALACVIRYAQRNSPGYPAAAQILLFISLCSKEMGITWLPLIALLHVCFPKRIPFRKKHLWTLYLPSILTTNVYLVLRFGVFYSTAIPSQYPGGSVWITMLNIPRIFMHYVQLCLYPTTLIADYNFSVYSNPLDLHIWLPFIAVAALIALLLYLPRRIAFWGWFYILHFLPVSNLIPFGAVVGERYMYFSTVGFAVIGGLIAQQIYSDRRVGAASSQKIFTKITLIALLAWLFIYQLRLITRAPDWYSDATLWVATERNSPSEYTQKFTFQMNLGNVYYNNGDYAKALQYYRKAYDINPNNVAVLNNIGNVHMKQGDYALAEKMFKRSIELKPSFLDSYRSLCRLYIEQKQFERALPIIEFIIKQKPESPDAYFLQGILHMHRQAYAEALTAFEQTLQYDRTHAGAYLNSAWVFMQLGKPSQAKAILRKGAQTLPDNQDIAHSLRALDASR